MGWPHDVVHACLHECMQEWCAPALAVGDLDAWRLVLVALVVLAVALVVLAVAIACCSHLHSLVVAPSPLLQVAQLSPLLHRLVHVCLQVVLLLHLLPLVVVVVVLGSPVMVVAGGGALGSRWSASVVKPPSSLGHKSSRLDWRAG